MQNLLEAMRKWTETSQMPKKVSGHGKCNIYMQSSCEYFWELFSVVLASVSLPYNATWKNYMQDVWETRIVRFKLHVVHQPHTKGYQNIWFLKQQALGTFRKLAVLVHQQFLVQVGVVLWHPEGHQNRWFSGQQVLGISKLVHQQFWYAVGCSQVHSWNNLAKQKCKISLDGGNSAWVLGF